MIIKTIITAILTVLIVLPISYWLTPPRLVSASIAVIIHMIVFTWLTSLGFNL